MATDYERVLYVCQEVFIYQIPPRLSTTRSVRAADWNLASPDWKGRLKVVSYQNKCSVKLEERSGELFAMCPVDAHPGVNVEPVSDSSRYFVLKLQESSGRHAFVGLGFQDRADSFDFNVSLQEHFKDIKRDLKIAQEASKPQPHVDYSLKAGQKISLNLSKKLHDEDTTHGNQPKPSTNPSTLSTGGGILLPPPPSGASVPVKKDQTSAGDDFGDFLSGGDSSGGGAGKGWVQF